MSQTLNQQVIADIPPKVTTIPLLLQVQNYTALKLNLYFVLNRKPVAPRPLQHTCGGELYKHNWSLALDSYIMTHT